MYKLRVIYIGACLLVSSMFVFGESKDQSYTFDKHPKASHEGFNIRNYIDFADDIQLIETYRIASPHGLHITFNQYVEGKEVLTAGAKLHLRNNGTFAVQNYMVHLPPLESNGLDKWYPSNTHLIPVYQTFIPDHIHPTMRYTDIHGHLWLEKEINKFNRKDTTLFTKVFTVNPINSANAFYGGFFVDNKDSSNSTLDSQMYWVKNPVQFENDTFFLASEFLSFANISLPFDSNFIITTDSFSVNRLDDRFEYLNVFYHINEAGNYVNKLGYDALTIPLKVDVHAFSGADNSAYSPEFHTLQFGDGGVDDAEDGEVVIHEFTHSLSEIASPNNTVGAERQAMEEGTCDYFAKAYSRTYNDNTPNKIFSWDAHNIFWKGFNTNTNRAYPSSLKGNKDGDRDVWSSALMCIHDSIGREATDSLVLEHLFYQRANTTMPQMAQLILQIDSFNFDKRYYKKVKGCFVEADFLKWNASISPKNIPSPLIVLNQQGFIIGNGTLQINLPKKASYVIYNTLGQVILSDTQSKIMLQPQDFSKGYYVIQINIDGIHYTQRIIR
jgi:hypothetical protein